MGNMKWVGCWIGGTLGTMLGSGILGTLAGFCLGSIIDEMMDSRADSNDYNTNKQDYYSQGNGYKQYQYGGQNGSSNAHSNEEQRNSFLSLPANLMLIEVLSTCNSAPKGSI